MVEELLKNAKDMRDPYSILLNDLYVTFMIYRDEFKKKAEEIEKLLVRLDGLQEERKKELEEKMKNEID